MDTPIPSIELFNRVKGGLIARGTNLTQWCRDNGSHVSNARTCLTGSWNGPKAREFRVILCREAGLLGDAPSVPRRPRTAA